MICSECGILGDRAEEELLWFLEFWTLSGFGLSCGLDIFWDHDYVTPVRNTISGKAKG